MPRITQIRPVLLSAPYADAANAEVRKHLRSGFRTCGMVEVTLDNGVSGLGEGYLAVFAPQVFVALVEVLGRQLIGMDPADSHRCEQRMTAVSAYWSAQGAARHAISALQIALVDAHAKSLGVPAYALYGGKTTDRIRLYGSGGDSTTPAAMQKELEQLASLGIDLFKIRARHHQVAKAIWTMKAGADRGIDCAIDMTQNLAVPGNPVADVVRFVTSVHAKAGRPIAFLEEALGLNDRQHYPLLRQRVDVPVCGGETCTTAEELCGLVEHGAFDFVQPDATVIGGIGRVAEVAACAKRHGMETVVHNWGGGVCLMANYHAAFATGSRLAEWPMPRFPLRDALLTQPLRIDRGRLLAPEGPGLGVTLTPEIEAAFAFRPDAVYDCAGSDLDDGGDAAWG